MLSKEDFKDYLRQLSFFESNMFYLYRTCSDKVEDGHIKDICKDLATQEAVHDLIVKKISKIFKTLEQ
ncbi:MAG: hypothetical protein HQ579_03630 [Candidatus Omnitrophica bacterium]|nr:hypothetical protein [Candidatus Omnitrophota bacterium]